MGDWYGLRLALSHYPGVQTLARMAQERTQVQGAARGRELVRPEGVLESGLRQVMEMAAGQQSLQIGKDLEQLRKQWGGRGTLFGHVEQGHKPHPVPRPISHPVGERTSPDKVTFLLRADLEGELDTGLTVRADTPMWIDVQGNCRLSPTLLTNPGGIELKGGQPRGNPILRPDATYPDYPCGSVVALIGTTYSLSIRGHREGTWPASGRLRLAINDVPGYYKDNRAPGGEIVVMAVTVKG